MKTLNYVNFQGSLARTIKYDMLLRSLTQTERSEKLSLGKFSHAINLGIRIKEYLGKQLTFKYNNIYLKKQVDIDEDDEDVNELSPSEFKNEIKKIYEERKQIDL